MGIRVRRARAVIAAGAAVLVLAACAAGCGGQPDNRATSTVSASAEVTLHAADYVLTAADAPADAGFKAESIDDALASTRPGLGSNGVNSMISATNDDLKKCLGGSSLIFKKPLDAKFGDVLLNRDAGKIVTSDAEVLKPGQPEALRAMMASPQYPTCLLRSVEDNLKPMIESDKGRVVEATLLPTATPVGAAARVATRIVFDYPNDPSAGRRAIVSDGVTMLAANVEANISVTTASVDGAAAQPDEALVATMTARVMKKLPAVS